MENIIKQFSKCRIAVIGDLITDKYVFGKSYRISREAPVIILKHSHDSATLGGAANAIHNIAVLGGNVFPVGVIGNDENGNSILEMLKKMRIETDGIVCEKGRKTISKTRILGCGHHTTYQQLVRIDYDDNLPISSETENRLISNIKTILPHVDAVIASDYNHGVFSDKMVAFINTIALTGDVPVFVDSRFDLLKFRSFFIATPNETEAEEALSMSVDTNESVENAAKKLIKITNGNSVLITRGNKGMALLEKGNKIKFISIYGGDEIADVTGAGDTVIGVLTLAAVSGIGLPEASFLANTAGGIVVMKSGTATVSPKELICAVKEYSLNSR